MLKKKVSKEYKERNDREEERIKARKLKARQNKMAPSETRVSEDGKTPPDMKEYMTAFQKRRAEQKMEMAKRGRTLLESEARAEQRDIAEELAIEKKRIQDEKERKQMRQRR